MTYLSLSANFALGAKANFRQIVINVEEDRLRGSVLRKEGEVNPTASSGSRIFMKPTLVWRCTRDDRGGGRARWPRRAGEVRRDFEPAGGVTRLMKRLNYEFDGEALLFYY